MRQFSVPVVRELNKQVKQVKQVKHVKHLLSELQNVLAQQ
jgi:hypothetical protein